MNLNQVTLPVLSLENSIPFYEKLGLKLIVKSAPRYARFELPEGEATFSLHLVDELPSGNGVILYFEVEDVEEKVNTLKTKGISFDTEPTAETWLWTEAKLKDPDGNQLIIYTAGSNRKNPPWRIKE